MIARHEPIASPCIDTQGLVMAHALDDKPSLAWKMEKDKQEKCLRG
jgi:hypothetical protein